LQWQNAGRFSPHQEFAGRVGDDQFFADKQGGAFYRAPRFVLHTSADNVPKVLESVLSITSSRPKIAGQHRFTGGSVTKPAIRRAKCLCIYLKAAK
jgi:hypothetical protein